MYLSVCMCVCMCAYNCKGHLLVDVEKRLMEFTVTFWVYSVVTHIGISGAQLGKWKVGQTSWTSGASRVPRLQFHEGTVVHCK